MLGRDSNTLRAYGQVLCVYECMYVCACAHMCASVCMCTHMYVYACLHGGQHGHVQNCIGVSCGELHKTCNRVSTSSTVCSM